METNDYKRGFFPYALAAFLIGLVGGFSTVLGPAFVADLGIAYSSTTWTALAQAMSTAACAPILGKLGDVLGRRTTLRLGLAVFLAGNVLSALADSLTFMLAARFIVGVGTAAMAPVIMAYIVTEFPRDRQAQGFSLYMLISSASVIAGPALGGVIVSHYGWRMLMWVCAVICAAVFAACLAYGGQRETGRRSLQGFDWPGAALAVCFFSLLLCLPAIGQNLGWDTPIFWAVLPTAAVSLAGLLAVEKRTPRPVLPGSFMKRRTFLLSVLALFLTQGLMQANMTNTIVFVNYTQPGNTAVSGYAISVMYLGMSLGALLLGPLADRLEPRWLLPWPLLLTGVGCGLQALFSQQTPLALLMAALGLLGFGLGAGGTIFMRVVLSGLTSREAGAATGTYGLFRDLAAPFGVAVFVPLFTNQTADLIAGGMAQAEAAVRAMRTLAGVEVLCAAGGMAAALCLPKLRGR